MAWRIYKEGNYIYAQEDPGTIVLSGGAKDVDVRETSQTDVYTVLGLNAELQQIPIANILKKDGSAYSSEEWKTFYENNTNFSSPSGGSGGDVEASSLTIEKGTSPKYVITNRFSDDTLAFPVSTVIPDDDNTVIAQDIMPKGSPLDNGDNGVAWVDVCNTDIQDNNAPVNCVRMGSGLTRTHFGSISFNGATHVPMEFVMGTAGNVVGVMQTDGSLEWVGNIKISPLASNDIATLTTESDASSATLATFPSTIAYDGGLFQNTTRLNVADGHLILATSSVNKDIIFITGGGLMSTNEFLRLKANGRLHSPSGETKYADNASAVTGGLVAGDHYTTPTGERRVVV